MDKIITPRELDQRIAGREILCTDFSDGKLLIVFADDSFIVLEFVGNKMELSDGGESYSGTGWTTENLSKN